MPELTEVETTRRGIEPHVVGRKVTMVTVRDRRLRWPISDDLEQRLQGARVLATRRRANLYLLIFRLGVFLFI